MRTRLRAGILRAAPFFLLFLLCVTEALANTAGPNSPGTAANNNTFGTQAWSNPARVKLSDDSRATATLNSLGITNYVKATNFSFAIPLNATINGIVVAIERSVNSVAGGSIVRDAAARLVRNGTVLATDRATSTPWNTTDVIESHGNATDLWGASWTPANVNNIGFGAAVAATKANNLSGNRQARIDHISITVYYSLPDAIPPNITLIGSNAWLEVGTAYTDAGATASDNLQGNITGAVSALSTVNASVLGSYTVTYRVNDSYGNNATPVVRNVSVVDTTAPAITVLGTSPVTVSFGSAYADAGATAADNYDGSLTGAISTVNPVTTAVLGTYTVTYDVSDSSGNPATQATRTVNVVDTDIPIITTLGTNPATVSFGSAYADAGATALDNADGDITASIVTVNSVNTAALGMYTVTYTVNDSTGNNATPVVRNVSVVDTTQPIITPAGSNPATAELGTAYSDAGATATDNHDGTITGAITAVSTVNMSALGNYTVTYSVNDSSGNNATAARTVNVVDTTPPVLTLLGPNPAVFARFAPYIEYGVQANENGTITITGQVDMSGTAQYTITYRMVDNSGNIAVPVTRIVNVGPNHAGLGTKEFSHFAPAAQGAAPEGTAAAAPAPAAAGTPGETAAGAPASAPAAAAPAPGEQRTAAEAPQAAPPARNPLPDAAAATEPRSPITGAVTGGGSMTPWYWLGGLLLLLALFGGYAYYRNRRR